MTTHHNSLAVATKIDESTEAWGRRFIRHFLTMDSFDKNERHAAVDKVHGMLGESGTSFAEVLHNSMGSSREDQAQYVKANQELGDQLDAMKAYIGTLEQKLARQSLPARFARAAKSLLRPNLEKLAYSGAVATMAATHAITGSVTLTLAGGIASGLALMIGAVTTESNSRATGRSVAIGLGLLAASAVTGAYYKGAGESKLLNSNPIPAMITADELGPKSVIVEYPFSRHISVITAAGKRDTITYTGDNGVQTSKNCTTYWKVEQDAVKANQNDPALRAIDFNAQPYQKVGDCELVAAYRKAQVGRAGQLQAQLNN